MGANGCRPQEKCWRGHTLGGTNSRPATGGGRRCVACNRAQSIAHNRHRRGWPMMAEAEIKKLADQKYLQLVPSARCRAITYTNDITRLVIRCTLPEHSTGSHV